MDKVMIVGAQKYIERNGVKIPVVESGTIKAVPRSGIVSGGMSSGNIRAFGGISKPMGWNAPPANRVAKKKTEPKGEKKAEDVIRKEEIPAKKAENIREETVKEEKLAEVAVEKEPTEEKIPTEVAESGVENHPETENQTGAETQAVEDKPKRGRGRRGRRRKQTAEDGMLI